MSEWSPVDPKRQFTVWMHLGGAVPSIYFTYYHLFHGFFWYGLTLLPCALSLILSLAMLLRSNIDNAYRVFDRWFLMSCLVPALVALVHPDLRGEYFVMPLVLICFTNLPLRIAQPLVLMFTTAAITLSFYSMGWHDGLRLAIGLVAAHCFAWGTAITLKRQHDTLSKMAFKDSLTDTYNRRSLFEELERSQNLYVRHRVDCSLILLDIDHFKQINDLHGHSIGDKVLVWLAEHLKENTRSSDRVFRYGGEEFLILLPKTNFSQAVELSEKIRQAIHAGKAPSDINVSFSAGCAEISNVDIDAWVACADEALYLAKHNGRDQTWPHQIG